MCRCFFVFPDQLLIFFDICIFAFYCLFIFKYGILQFSDIGIFPCNVFLEQFYVSGIFCIIFLKSFICLCTLLCQSLLFCFKTSDISIFVLNILLIIQKGFLQFFNVAVLALCIPLILLDRAAEFLYIRRLLAVGICIFLYCFKKLSYVSFFLFDTFLILFEVLFILAAALFHVGKKILAGFVQFFDLALQFQDILIFLCRICLISVQMLLVDLLLLL